MAILAIDTTMGACSAALGHIGDDGEPRIVGLVEPLARGHAERIVPMIGELMDTAGADFSDVRRLAVTLGPGTFTGVRSGLAVAKGLALATGVSLQGTSSTHVMARELRDRLSEDRPHQSEPWHLMIACDARRGEIYCQRFDANAVPLDAPKVCAVEDALRGIGDERLIIAGSAAGAVLNAARAIGIDAVNAPQPTAPDARWLAQLALEDALPEGPPTPIYLRRPDAKSQVGASVPRR